MRQRANDAAAEEQGLTTPWNLGDSTFPLRQEFLNNFFSDFRQRATGLAKMREYVDEEEIQTYLSEVDRGSKTYHSMDATSLVARASLCQAIAPAQAQNATTASVLAVRTDPKPCCLKHPGICADADGSGSMAAIKALVKAFPTECCLLRCETKAAGRKPRLVIYVKAVLGSDSLR